MAEAVKKERLQLNFAMSSPLQRRAWELLCAIPKGQRMPEISRAICQLHDVDLILDHVLDRVLDRVRDSVRETVREELRTGGIVQAEEGVKGSAKNREAPEEAAETATTGIDDDYLSFMSALDNEDEDG